MPGWTAGIADRGAPIYRAIADALEDAVARGELGSGDRLPTHRDLAGTLGIDLTTVTRAYAEARRRGLIEGTVGRGTFVCARSPKAAPVGAGPIDLSMNLPPLPADPSLAQLIPSGLARLLTGPARTDVLTYRVGAGGAEQHAASEWLRPSLGTIAPDRILVSSGAQPALLGVLDVVAPAGSVVLTDTLTYPGLRAAAAQRDVRLVGIAADRDGPLPDALDAACAEHGPAGFYAVPTIHNPTTATMSPRRREQLAALARRRAIWVIEDDAYGLLPSAPQPALAALAPECTFHIATVSKVLSPALRIAFVVAPDAASQTRLAAALRANTFMASPLLAALVAMWLRDGTAAAIAAAIRTEAAARQRLAREILPSGAFDAHPEGLHVWLRLPPGWGRLDFVAQARQRGLAVVPSDAFAVGGVQPDAVRLALGAAPDRDTLRTALTALAALLAQPGPAAGFSGIV